MPYIHKQLNVPVYGSKSTLGLVKIKLKEHNLFSKCELNAVSIGDIIDIDSLKVEFIGNEVFGGYYVFVA